RPRARGGRGVVERSPAGGVRRTQVALLDGLLPRRPRLEHRGLRRPARRTPSARMVGRMSGAIVLGRELVGDLALDVDAVVVGTGAGGSIALRELARAGLDVVALEEGAYSTPRDFNQREDEMIGRLFQDAGGRATEDLGIRVLQGRGVGGSTVHNTNLCKRTPDAILDLWARTYSVVGAAPADLRAAFETIERDLSVSEIPASMRNANNEVLRAGCEALGWRGAPLWHNRVGCQQSGFCAAGRPCGAVAGRFDRDIRGWRGIPQSFECTEHLSHEEGSDKRVWIVPAFAHPIGAAATLPGFGAAHMAALRSYQRLAVLSAVVHDETRGDVDVDGDGHPILRYVMSDRDRGQLAKGLVACARLLLAAGAVEVT